MSFKPAKKPVRVKVNYSLAAETRAKLDKLAKAYDTTPSGILDAMVETYGDKLLAEAKRK